MSTTASCSNPTSSGSEEPERFCGIAEIYAYEERKPKASIGYHLARAFWNRGFATETARLLKEHLLDEGVRTIAAHVMAGNTFSGRAVGACGFRPLYTDVSEDWGMDEPVLVAKYVFKRRWLSE